MIACSYVCLSVCLSVSAAESEASNGRHDSAAVMLKPSEALSSQSVSSSKHTGDDALSAV